MLWTWQNIEICWILKAVMTKRIFCSKKGPPEIQHFWKNWPFPIFSVLCYSVSLVYYKYCKTKKKNWQKVSEKNLLTIIRKKLSNFFPNLFVKAFFTSQTFFLFSDLICSSLWQLSSCTDKSKIGDFRIWFSCLFLDLSTSAGMSFWLNSSSSPFTSC